MEKRDKGWTHKRPISVGDMGAPTFEVIFRDTSDGKHYAMHYYRDTDTGIDTFEGVNNDDLFKCHEVEKKEVVAVSWVKV